MQCLTPTQSTRMYGYNHHMPDLFLIANDLNLSTKIYNDEKLRLLSFLKPFKVEIEHIGSTSLANSIGKGIIDIIVACNDAADQLAVKELLITHGYRQGELNKKPDGRLFFLTVPGQAQAGDIHLHLVLSNSDHHLQAIGFRNYLQKNSAELTKYNQEKIRLAKLTHFVRQEYTAQKAPFIQEILSRISMISLQ